MQVGSVVSQSDVDHDAADATRHCQTVGSTMTKQLVSTSLVSVPFAVNVAKQNGLSLDELRSRVERPEIHTETGHSRTFWCGTGALLLSSFWKR